MGSFPRHVCLFDIIHVMERNERCETPKYGMEHAGTHVYSRLELSGLPASYAKTVLNIIKKEQVDTGGVFVDVGAGTGALGEHVRKVCGMRVASMDYSPFGISQSPGCGIVADAKHIPCKENSAAVIHIKDVIEHFNDKELTEFLHEAHRVLTHDGIVLLTEVDYYKHMPSHVSGITLVTNGKQIGEESFPNETYEHMVWRLHKYYGDTITVGFLYYPRSRKHIMKQVGACGFQCKKIISWQAKEQEPDWFDTVTPPRDIYVLGKSKEEKSFF